MLAWAAIVCTCNWGWVNCFQDGTLTWLLAGGLGFSLCDTDETSSIGGLRVNLTWQLVSTRAVIQGRAKGSHMPFYEMASETTYHHFCLMLLGTQTHHDTVREGNPHAYQKTGITGGLPGDWLLQSLVTWPSSRETELHSRHPHLPCSMARGLGVTFR